MMTAMLFYEPADRPRDLLCRVAHRLELHDVDGNSADQHLVVRQVLGVHVDKRFIADGRVDTAAVRPIARCGYTSDYPSVDAMFAMERPD
jgi:flavin reductase (DIM6/NTAB) family NADH-FMN oxidoreductase RutF